MVPFIFHLGLDACLTMFRAQSWIQSIYKGGCSFGPLNLRPVAIKSHNELTFVHEGQTMTHSFCLFHNMPFPDLPLCILNSKLFFPPLSFSLLFSCMQINLGTLKTGYREYSSLLAFLFLARFTSFP